MTKINTYFNITDNSGVKKILCIQNLTKKTKLINVGDLIVGVIKKINTTSKLIYSTIVYGIVIRLKKNISINKKYNISFNDNAVVLVDKNLNPIGSRIFGSVPKYLKQKNCLKLHSLTIDLI
uniref:Ribosomal protein L14 n=1 Tax=Cyclospora cayetanensis TaxID=88456 RepID=A0A0K0NU68_9EIME|nr:ribosomal protein L14 [Cyclospora cayetanensis]AKO71985.1 ribosomal protein L14 [Cyclospora cayetanensis]